MDSLAERIIKDLDIIFSKDPYINDFSILPVNECLKNKCPVVQFAHSVAIESWCLKHVYRYAYHQMLQLRQQRSPSAESLLALTRAVLLINPDVQVAWNIRKELLTSEKQDIHSELNFSAVVLSRKPKCADAFVHRRWLLSLLSEVCPLPMDLTQKEFTICTKASESYAHNYYSWSHRIWLAQRTILQSQRLLDLELLRNEDFLEKHISEHGAFHYRQFLLQHILPHCNSPANILQKELKKNLELITFYPGHEALWCHRRFLLHAAQRLVPNSLEIQRNEEEFLQGLPNAPQQALFLQRHRHWIQNYL